MRNVRTVGIDLAKRVFQLHGQDERGHRVLRKRLPRGQLEAYLAQLPCCVVAMEACGSAHYWARRCQALGHEVMLIAPQHVKPYRRGHKNDYRDAAAICEAATRPEMPTVAVRSAAQQDLQALHRVLAQRIKQRTATANQLRGLLAEYGIVLPQGLAQLRRALPAVLEDGDNGLSEVMRELLGELYDQLTILDRRIATDEQRLARLCQQDERCRLLVSILGIGVRTATALVARFGDGQAINNGRQLAGLLGLLPGQHSSGERQRLLGISRCGDPYLRTLLIHGARAVLRYAERYDDRRSQWLRQLKARRGANVAAVALAHKNARIAYALLRDRTSYQPAA